MNRRQLEEKARAVAKEVEDLQKKYDEMNSSVKRSSIFNTEEDERELEIISKELRQKKLILKEFNERLRTPRDASLANDA